MAKISYSEPPQRKMRLYYYYFFIEQLIWAIGEVKNGVLGGVHIPNGPLMTVLCPKRADLGQPEDSQR